MVEYNIKKQKVAIITDSNTRVQHLLDTLRKLSYPAYVIKPKQSVLESLKSDNFTFVLLDLAIELNQAFLLIEQIYEYCEKQEIIILAIISNKTQIKRLRIQALGASGYISPLVERSELLKKLEYFSTLDKDLSIDLNRRKVVTKSNALITHIGETGLKFNSQIKLKKNQVIKLNGPIINELELDNTIFKTTSIPSMPLADKKFTASISFIGISDHITTKIRKAIFSWSI